MGLVGVLVLALVAARPAAGADDRAAVTARLVRVAVVLGVLALPAVFLDRAHGLDETGGLALGAAWHSLYDGTAGGLLFGLELTLTPLAVVLAAPVASRRVASGSVATWLLVASAAASSVALGTTKFPDERPDDWGRAVFETLMWMLHLGGGAVWVGGLMGLIALTLPGAVSAEGRGRFWARTIRRFSAAAMACVGAIVLSGLWLYWKHVDGPSQLFTTLYGQVLGVKILIFGTMLVLGAANQFWLHPRIEQLRAAGDERPLLTLLAREFPIVIALEVVLGIGVLLVAPFLHGSARNQVFQENHPAAAAAGQKIADKEVSGSTWAYGTTETVAVVLVMVAGYRASGQLARRRTLTARVSPEL